MAAQGKKNISFCDLVNLKDTQESNPEQLWRSPASSTINRSKRPSATFKSNYKSPTQSPPPSLQSNLLESALSRIRSDRQKFQLQAISDLLSQQSSNFIFSRENTPANFTFPKKRNKHKTAGSDLFDIESKGSERRKDGSDQFDGLVLYPHLIGLSDAVYAEVMGRERKVNGKLIHNWKDCLLAEDKQEVYGNNAPYTFSRVFPVNELEKGFNEIYGSGKKRCLRLGQQSLLIHHMQKYLQKCSTQLTKIARKDYDILSDILKSSKLEQLEQLPTCMRQVQLLWKILATQWRYSGKLDHKNKILESALINGKSNFVDLKKENAVTAFLLRASNYGDIAEGHGQGHGV